MRPDTIITDFEIADVSFQAQITFDYTPAYGEHDEAVFVTNIRVMKALLLNLMNPYHHVPEFKARIDQMVLDEIHGRSTDSPRGELVDARWE